MTAKEPPRNVIDPPRSTDGFRAIREEGRCFVDNTDVIARLSDVGDFLIFLRPAGFGKSLLVSTLAAMWRGGPDAVRGLRAEGCWRHESCRVVVIDLSAIHLPNPWNAGAFASAADELLRHAFAPAGFATAAEPMEPLVRWRAFLEASRGVVLLVDGIDAPLRKAPEEGRAEVGRFLEGFLTMVKNLGSGLRFCLITGEAMGLDLAAAVNNFSDVSGDLPFGDLLGFTTADLRTGLRPLVERKAEAWGRRRRRWSSRLSAPGEDGPSMSCAAPASRSLRPCSRFSRRTRGSRAGEARHSVGGTPKEEARSGPSAAGRDIRWPGSRAQERSGSSKNAEVRRARGRPGFGECGRKRIREPVRVDQRDAPNFLASSSAPVSSKGRIASPRPKT